MVSRDFAQQCFIALLADGKQPFEATAVKALDAATALLSEWESRQEREKATQTAPKTAEELRRAAQSRQ